MLSDTRSPILEVSTINQFCFVFDITFRWSVFFHLKHHDYVLVNSLPPITSLLPSTTLLYIFPQMNTFEIWPCCTSNDLVQLGCRKWFIAIEACRQPFEVGSRGKGLN